ncbi:hypothetical protein WME75_33440 [Sorangium sp. So ce1014]
MLTAPTFRPFLTSPSSTPPRRRLRVHNAALSDFESLRGALGAIEAGWI